MACKNFIMEVVHETWYNELEDPDTLYRNVMALKLLDDLTEFCLRLHTIDAMKIPQLIKTLFTIADGTPQFIHAMKAAQKTSKRAKLVIQDDYMHAVALKLLPKLGEYETEMREWSKLPDDKKTWTAWKITFMEAYVAKIQAETAREEEEKPFSGSAVNDTHEKLRRRGHTASSVPYPLPNQMLYFLKGFLNRIAVAATQAFAKGGPLAELSASLVISIDTLAEQQK